MRILMITSEFPPTIGGVGSHVYELSRALAALGHQISIVTLPIDGEPEKKVVDGLTVERPSLVKWMPWHDYHLKAYLTKRLRKEHVDVIHVHGLRGVWGASGHGVPVVFTNHTSGFLKRLQGPAWKRWRTLQRIRHVNAIIAPSHELCDAVRSVGYQGPVAFISNGVDADKFSPGTSKLKSVWRDDDDVPVILMARRLVEKNGVRYFVQALKHINALKFKAVIAGDGPERQWMERYVHQHGLSDKVEFLGGVLNSDMPEIYRAADISVLPSLMEATSIAGLEAMATGLPLVGTHVGGIPTLIEDGINGFLVPPKQPEAMAEKLKVLITDSSLRRQMSQSARARVEKHFTWSVIAAETEKVYAKCLAECEVPV